MNCHILPFAEPDAKIRLMYMDEAGFGRISDMARCWVPKGVRPIVYRHHIREYKYAYGAVDPVNGDNFFLVLPNCDTVCMNVFLRELSAAFPKDYLLLGADNAVWHKAKALEIPDNISFFYLPPRTPELNPIEQIWKEVRKRGFKNKIFKTLDNVVDQLCFTLNSLTNDSVKSITGRDWILQMF
jgi:putative transposase